MPPFFFIYSPDLTMIFRPYSLGCFLRSHTKLGLTMFSFQDLTRLIVFKVAYSY